MQYFSTNRRSPCVTFREATLKGQPDDRGLYFPADIPQFSAEFIESLRGRSNSDIAFEVMRPYAEASIPDKELYEICAETVNFAFPLVEISDRIFVLELFHGPTLAFKDVGARFMSRCLRYFSRQVSIKTIVVVATSGDTGGAVAAGFHNVDNVEVVILYPSGKVSEIQELQLTMLGGNVTALEVAGVFDDCQALAKTRARRHRLNKPSSTDFCKLDKFSSVAAAADLLFLCPQAMAFFRSAGNFGAERQFWQSRLRNSGECDWPADKQVHCGMQCQRCSATLSRVRGF